MVDHSSAQSQLLRRVPKYACDVDVGRESENVDLVGLPGLETYAHDASRSSLGDAWAYHAGSRAALGESDSDEVDAISFDQDAREACHRWRKSRVLDIDMLPPVPASSLEEMMGSPDAEELEIYHALLAHSDHLLTEKWQVDRQTAELLLSIHTLLTESSLPVVSPVTFRGVKVDEPALDSDHDVDLKELYRRNAIHISAENIEPFELDIEKGETLRWSKKDYDMLAKIESDAIKARLPIDRETAEFLRGVMVLTSDVPTHILGRAVKPKVTTLKLSPVLLPLQDPYSPPDLPSELAQVDFTSTPEDLSIREAAELEARIAQLDNIDVGPGDEVMEYEAQPRGFSDVSPLMSLDHPKSRMDTEAVVDPSKGAFAKLPGTDIYHQDVQKLMLEVASSPPQRESKRLRDLKVESPLLIASDEESPSKKLKHATYPEEICALIPSPQSPPTSTSPKTATEQARMSVTEMLTPLAAPALQNLANEELDELDTVLRIPVPEITNVEAASPWRDRIDNVDSHESSRMPRRLLAETRSCVAEDERRWTGVSRIERSLPWSSFPSGLGKIKPEGDFDDGSFVRYMVELGLDDEILPSALTWKPQGFRILDSPDNGEEDEVEAMQIVNYESAAEKSEIFAADQESPDVVALDEEHRDVPHLSEKRPGKEDQGWTGMDALLRRRRCELAKNQEKIESRRPIISGQPVSAHVNLISKFMRSQGQDVDTPCVPDAESCHGQQGVMPSLLQVPGPISTESESVSVNACIPVPDLDPPDRSIPVIVSSTALANRHLVRKLTDLLPALNLIERSASVITLQPLDAKVGSKGEMEADFTVSPSTGLMITTLQKVKQKALPGQTIFHGVRERILCIAPQYERIVLFIGQGMSTSHAPHIQELDERDAAALADLIELTSGCPTDVRVHYVAGGEDEVAKWVAAAICQYASTEAEFSLLEDETFWERFLRISGMNAFAAQTVLAILKPSSTGAASEALIPSSSLDFLSGGGGSGLAALVTMNAEQRVQRLGPSMGGDQVLRRISAAIDAKSWTANTKAGFIR